jgi:hypothetical protein
MSTFFQSFADAAPFSWIAATMGAVVASWLLAVLLRARLATPRRWLGFPILCSLALVITTAAAIAAVEIGRRDVAGQLGTRQELFNVASNVISRGIARQFAGLALLGPIALVFLVSASLLRWDLRERSAVPAPRARGALGVIVVLPLIIGAVGAFIYGLSVHAGWVGLAAVDPSEKERVMLERLQRADHLLTLLRASVVAAAGAGSIAAIAWARAAGARPLGRARVAMASVLFAAGLGAFVSTRGQAADRPLQMLAYNQRNSFGTVFSQEMPRFSRCPPLSAGAPVLEFSTSEVMFDGGQVSPEDIHDKLVTEQISFPLLHPGQPPRPPTMHVVADVATPIDRMLPYLAYAGDVEIVMVGSNPRPFASRTLGVIERREFCFRAFSLREDDGVPLSGYRTWRDLALAVDRSAAVLRIAAR